MRDRFGREINYLRISVTRRCNFHCAYCGAAKSDARELTPEQFAAFAAAFARAGITKIRLTGGEPLIRDDIAEIAEAVRAAALPETLAITTNGFLLKEKAPALKQAGVDAVNISLDTLDPECFRRMTGRDALAAVLEGLETALAQGFKRVKVNAVLLRGVNDGDAERLAALARDYPLDVRFIELMPTGDGDDYQKRLIPSGELLARFPHLSPVPGEDGAAEYYAVEGYRGRIGLISPVSKKFCNDCSRIRLLADGQLKPCLGQKETYDLLPYLNEPDRLYEAICQCIRNKPAGHHFEKAQGLAPMNQIGG
ncbi:MAG: GTP 3',8-cyclase MoaA [Clostridia bacterium]|nr:GTP 3',8-cyclase MoaA [Clostridia bacterium]